MPDFVCCAICSCAALWRGRVAGGCRFLACICRCLAMAGLPCSLQCCATATPFCRLPARPVGIGPLLFCLCRMPSCARVYAALPVVAGGLYSKMQGGCLGAVRSRFMCRGHAAGPVCRHVWLRSCVSPANRGTFDGGLRLVGLFLFRRLPDMLIVSAFASARALAYACGHCGGCGAALPAGRRHRACTLPCAGGVTASPSS